MQYYFPSQRKLHVNGNLATWMILRAPPTSASLFWFYYNCKEVMHDKVILRGTVI